MKFRKKYTDVLFFIFASYMINIKHVACHLYEKREKDKHIIHIITLNPREYDVSLVRASDRSGRETVSDIAAREGAHVAVNGGFFGVLSENFMGPVGTLVIRGHIYNLRPREDPFIVIDRGKLSVVYAHPRVLLAKLSKTASILSGRPLLVRHHRVETSLFKKKHPFFIQPQARTALGVRPDGTVLIVVVEHHYLKDLSSISIADIQELVKMHGHELVRQFHHADPGDMTLKELKTFLKETLSSGAQGLSIVELAQLMQELSCAWALNLDGGGSSTLYLDHKVVNQTVGDQDEAEGVSVERPVTDVIVFKKKINAKNHP